MGICKFFKYIIYQHVQYPQIARNWGIFTEFKGCCKGVWSFPDLLGVGLYWIRRDGLLKFKTRLNYWCPVYHFYAKHNRCPVAYTNLLMREALKQRQWVLNIPGKHIVFCHSRENLTVCQVDFPWLFGNKNFRGRFLSPLNICVGKHNP